jgi:hypothetical protein
MFNRKSSIAAALLAVGTVFAGTAQASNVQWSIGINLPPVATVIASEPVYHAAPTYYAPAPVYVQPAPVVVYRPAPRVVYRPEPVYAPRYYAPAVVRAGWAVPSRGHGHGHGHGRGHDHDRYDNHRDHDGRSDGHRGRGQPEQRRHHH